MEVAVIIPAKNEEKYLPNLLTSLKNQTFKKFKIFVADAESTDDTREIAKKYGAVITRGGLPAVARDIGAKEAIKRGAKVLIFIDADVVLPTTNFIEKSVREFKERELDVATTEMYSYDDSKKEFKKSNEIKMSALYLIYNTIMKFSQNGKRPFMQNYMMSTSEVHRKIGGFGKLEFGEDSEYSKKAVQRGYKFRVLNSPGNALVSPRRFNQIGFWKLFFANFYMNARIILGHKFRIQEKNIYFK